MKVFKFAIVLATVSGGALVFQNCSGSNFNTELDQVSNLSSEVESATGIFKTRLLQSSVEASYLINIDQVAVSSGVPSKSDSSSVCSSFLKTFAATSPISFRLASQGKFTLKDGLRHPRYSVLTVRNEDREKLKSILSLTDVEGALYVNGQLNKQSSLLEFDSNRLNYHLSFNHVTSEAQERPAGTSYRLKYMCSGIVLAESETLVVKHLGICGPFISNAPIDGVSANDVALGNIIRSVSSSFEKSVFPNLSSAQVMYEQPDYYCGAMRVAGQTPQFPARKNSSGFSFNSTELEVKVQNTIELRNCRQDVRVVANLLALYMDASQTPKCVSSVAAVTYNIATASSSAAATGASCQFPGGKDPDSSCQFAAFSAANGERKTGQSTSGFGTLSGTCVNGEWRDVVVTCMVEPANSIGDSCSFPGAKDPHSNCRFAGFSASSGERISSYTTDGGMGRLVGTCVKGQWKDVAVSCR